MNQQRTQNNKGFLRNDRKLVCSMLVIYGLCILGLVGATVWGLDRISETSSANATSTAAAAATRRAKGTSTAAVNATSTALAISAQHASATAAVAARSTEQAQYSFLERFDDNSHAWLVKSIDDEYMLGSLAIDGGVYVWNVQEVKKPFFYQSVFPVEDQVKDFDAYVDFKIAEGASENVCGGFLFRTASGDWKKGAYIFSVCGNSYFYAGYNEQENSPPTAPSNWRSSDVIQRFDWNRLAISARGDHFVFLINNQIVFEMTDERQPVGGLSLFGQVFEQAPTIIWFDNFGFQPR